MLTICLFSAAFLSEKIRLLDGSTITTSFKAQEPLAAVRVYVQMNGNTPEGQDFMLLSPYPRQVYTELDMEKPLKELSKNHTTYILHYSDPTFKVQGRGRLG